MVSVREATMHHHQPVYSFVDSVITARLICSARMSVRVPATDHLDSWVCLQLSERASVKLYYGTRAQTTTPFQEAAAGWATAGVELVNVYSSDKKGYVQVCCASSPGSLPTARDGQVAPLQTARAPPAAVRLHSGMSQKD